MNNIVILGGGSAGWITALFIQKTYPSTSITVIEDPATPPIIAGESGSALFNKIYNYLDINFDDWVSSVNAMPKLGGTFTDWNGVGTDFVHGLIPDWYKNYYESQFPEFGRNNDFIGCALAEGIKLEDVFYNGRLQRISKLPITPSAVPNEKFHVISMPMWHFDSRANADYLKQVGISRGIKLIEGKYQSTTRLASGGIQSLTLESGEVVAGEWFFDCSGFARLLMHKELNVPLTDLTNIFPAREVVSWWDEDPRLVNYTGVTAMKYGWRWDINLRNRAGNGYIFDPDHINVDQAIAEVEAQLGKKINPVANLKFTPQQMQIAWKENVFAFGLSSGFIEPLESNGLLVVVAQLELLSDYWAPGIDHNSVVQSKFNQEFISRMDDIRDFLSMHYRGHRRDTDFWKSHAYDKCRVPDSLKLRLEMFDEGILGINDTISYGFESYATVAQGLGLVNLEKLRHRLQSKRSSIFDDFKFHYSNLSKEIEQISNICYTVEQWRDLYYGKN